jgi:glycosyltransferase involved in cell wall biosynthesis
VADAAGGTRFPVEKRMNVWHIVTSEYPPDVGGVSDYTRQVALGLAGAGDEVHVWCPRADATHESNVRVHPELGGIGLRDLRRLDRLLNQYAGPRRLLVQWVPHGFGYHSMNVWFCVWLAARAWRGDRVELMVHEPYLAFGRGPLRHAVMAFVHRVMTMLLLGASRRVWMSIPAWEARLRPYALGRSIPMTWLPVPGCTRSAASSAIGERRRTYAGADQLLIGHFGTYGDEVCRLLEARLPAILDDATGPVVLLMGAGSDRFRSTLLRHNGAWGARVRATGYLAPDDLVASIAACDLVVQPYPDGISSRRTTAMTCLAAGRPVVTTRGHLTEPLWDESQGVLLADVHDPSSFVEAVKRALADRDYRGRLAGAGRRLYEEHFSVERVVSTLRAA